VRPLLVLSGLDRRHRASERRWACVKAGLSRRAACGRIEHLWNDMGKRRRPDDP
jgi:hypothetical protein